MSGLRLGRGGVRSPLLHIISKSIDKMVQFVQNFLGVYVFLDPNVEIEKKILLWTPQLSICYEFVKSLL